MGNQLEKKASTIKKKLGISEQNSPIKDNTIGIEFECPNCSEKFGPKALQIEVVFKRLRSTST